jgi:pantothenate kinase type III
MGNLFADIGNSALKLYTLQGERFVFSYEEAEGRLLQSLKEAAPESILVSSVSRRGWLLLDSLLKGLSGPAVKVIKVDYTSPFSFGIDIEQPETVGLDRLLNCEAVLFKGIEPPFMVVDTGSAVTIDLVIKEGKSGFTSPARQSAHIRFKGGLIIPGEKLQKQALEAFTSIPSGLIFKDVTTVGEKTGSNVDIYPLFGKNSSEAITFGIRNCLIYGINEILARLQKKYILNTLILTGGNGKTLFDDLAAIGYFNSQVMVCETELAYYGFLSLAKKLKML